jgi:hypothetical protein
MRKHIVFLLVLLLGVSGSWAATKKVAKTTSRSSKTSAGKTTGWNFSGKIGVTESGSDVGMQGGLIAEYSMSTRLSWRTDLNFVFADLSDMEQVTLSVPSNLLYYPLGNNAVFCPYLGPGLNAVLPVNDDFTAGFNGIVGTKFKLTGKPVFGIEGRYTVPDFGTPEDGNFEVALTGSWQLEF